MKRIAITGSSGYIGTNLVQALLARPDVESIIGIDIQPMPIHIESLRAHVVSRPTLVESLPAHAESSPVQVVSRPAHVESPSVHIESVPERFHHVAADIRQPVADIFRREGVDTAVHLAVVFAPTRRREWSRAVNVDGTRNFLDACRAAGVRRAVFLSSATAYGAFADNPGAPGLDESAPLRAGPGFAYAYDKRCCDEMCQRFIAESTGGSIMQGGSATRLAILRPPIVLGAGVDNYFSRTWFKPKVVHARGDDPPMQFIHEADVCEAIVSLLASDAVGPFNAAPDDTVTFTQFAAEFKRAPLALPPRLLRALCAITYHAGLRGINETPPGALDYIRFPWTVSAERLRRETGFVCKHTSLGTVRAWRNAVNSVAAGRGALPGKYRD